MVAERYCLLPRPVTSVPTQEPLSPVEQRVLAYVCAGYSNKETCSPSAPPQAGKSPQFLGKAEPTVKHQVSACLKKFGLSSRMRLMAALRWGGARGPQRACSQPGFNQRLGVKPLHLSNAPA